MYVRNEEKIEETDFREKKIQKKEKFDFFFSFAFSHIKSSH